VRHTPAGCNISVRWYRRGGVACFEVRDTGEGIAVQHLSRLTERFYHVDAGRSRDSSLDFAIVDHALKRHQSKLQISSELGVGSRLYCYFPRHLLVAGPYAAI